MSSPNIPGAPDPESSLSEPSIPESPAREPVESFGALLSEFELSHSHQAEGDSKQLTGTVVSVSADSVLLDIGFKVEGALPLSALRAGEIAKPGDRFPVTVKGRNEEGYYELSRLKIAQPTDWTSLEQAFAEKSIVMGVVTSAVKGGLSVDVGVRAFLPASRSGARDAAELGRLVGQEIRCRILKLEAAEEDVVVDRRAVLEEEAQAAGKRRYAELKEGDTVEGEVRSLTSYGAFVDLGGVDGLLHIGDIAWGRVNQPGDVLSIGQRIEARVLKVEPERRRVSLGLKQLQPNPWDQAAEKYKTGERVRGAVSRLTDFGAFVELEPGVDGLIHLSEMSWAKKVRRPADLLKPGDVIEAVVLSVSGQERRISLGLKQALGDPWADVSERFPAGSVAEGPITGFTKFGAFVQVAEGIEGMIHISEISAEKHLHHPQDVLKMGQTVRAQVLEVDPIKRQFKLSVKKLVPVSLDEYMAEHKQGDAVTGRLIEMKDGVLRVELGEGIEGVLLSSSGNRPPEEPRAKAKADLSSLSSMLQARWKEGAPGGISQRAEAPRAGQIRSFRIAAIDPAAKRIELDLA